MNDQAPQAITGVELTQACDAIRGEISRAFVGQRDVLDQLLVALLAGGHVLVEGVPGLGKTLLVRALAAAMKSSFARVQFTPDLMPSDVTGHAFYDPKTEGFRIRRGPVFANLLLADEINRAPAKTQAALLEAMQEQQVTIEARSLPLPAPFMTVATQNPIEQEGTYPLPEAQLDRFMLKLLIDYPPVAEEVAMVTTVTGGRAANQFDLGDIRAVTTPEELVRMQLGTALVRVDPVVVDYAVRLARATREFPGLTMGAGPRGSIALVRAARACAVLDGRDFVTPDDIGAIAKPALRHRVALGPELQIEGRRIDDVLAVVLAKVEAPRK
ncbi:MAG TPA: MoxR family ATPase [Candidatus Saccharimonadia bacterium]|nr:MoxR family ATPase [Candidatus Saccharimonadia bacterium]